jgi:hypothetical protein
MLSLPILIVLAGAAPDWLHGWPAALPVFLIAFELCASACLTLISFFRRSWRAMALEQVIGLLTFVALWMALFAMFDAWKGDKSGRTQMGVEFRIFDVLRYWRYVVVALASSALTLLAAWHATRPAAPERKRDR